MSRPRILFYSLLGPGTFWGGSEKFWYETILHPSFRQAFDCAVLLADSPETREKGNSLTTLGIPIEYYPCPWPKPSLTQRALRRVQRVLTGERFDPERHAWRGWIRRFRPDLVWLNLPGVGCLPEVCWIAEVLRERGVPYVLILQHCPEHVDFGSDERTNQLLQVVKEARRTIFIADRNWRALERCLGEHLTNAARTVNAIPHDFILEAAAIAHHQPPRRTGTARLLNLARFSPSFKGQHILLEVLANGPWRQRDWTLIMQGWLPFRETINKLVRYFGLPGERIQILDFTPNPIQTIAQSDLCVLPSLSEGTPFALVESMACGRPAVGTPVGGIPELIHDGQTGWLARSTEVPDLAEALERAWQDRNRWAACGENARQFVSEYYDRDRTVDPLIALLKQAVAG